MKRKIVFLVLPHVHLMDLAGPDQVFNEAIGFDVPIEILYCTTTQQVSTSAQMPIGNLSHFSFLQLSENDMLIVPGAEVSYLLSDEFRNNHELHQWIRQSKRNGVMLCSICSGAFALAQSGILNGLRCTTHWKRTKQLQELFPLAKVEENILFTEDDGVYTSAGVAAGIDLALYILEKISDSYTAHKVARELVVYTRRSGNEQQFNELYSFRNHIHAGIQNVQDWLHENLHKKTSIRDLATIAHMSERNFTRTFKKETSVTVNKYITTLRLQRIQQLLNNPDISNKEIARLCGLKSERQLARLIAANN